MIVNVKQNSGFNKLAFRHYFFLAVILQKVVNIIAYVYSDFSVAFVVFIQSFFFCFFG